MKNDPVSKLLKGFGQKDRGALARILTQVEKNSPADQKTLSKLFAQARGVKKIGITGPPGAGKSTMINRLIGHYRSQKKTVACVLVDPSSPISGGAVLGDRIRMQEHFLDRGVFLRSVASRGEHGGLCRAAIEMAASSGLPLVPEAERNPMLATTRGFGELIRDAARRGARSLILGIGGSATVDGGAGMAAALGVRFLDDRGRALADGGGALEKLARIDAAGLDPAVRSLEIKVACDVDSPLLGPAGAARMFGPQKGATPEMVERLEAALARFAERVRVDLGRDVADLPGAGAAGGLGAGLVAFLGARLVPGAELVMDALDFDARLGGVALLVTGEGALDAQSLLGGVVSILPARIAYFLDDGALIEYLEIAAS
jgi:hypothetical protein